MSHVEFEEMEKKERIRMEKKEGNVKR